ncbi:TIGR03086 family metal-binding protein [Streptomyces sp. DSM 42041]|uniref:TIGR03086 family metal-binding protein n=1 Tax=Streptomyces hazeniae TaxID=3075538 RepID=A0ABU2NTT2_9ACTN|nr:TIGR03086 family metal-binding protein [Streptomyces sp. DSM 42041]MDT0380401.1 TIGR03086 family metal-binding protein [Streptomyces sp. DSM 42041]
MPENTTPENATPRSGAPDGGAGAAAPRPDLRDAADRVAALVAEIRDDELGGPTPCEDMSVGALLDHLMGLTLAFRLAAEKVSAPRGEDGAPPPGPGEPSADRLDPAWRSELPARLDALVTAWRSPAAWEGEAEAGGVVMPAEVMGLVAMNELVVHGWDVARATGRPYACAPETVDGILVFLRRTAEETGGQGAPGLFGPVVPVPGDAPPLDRAVGLAGRDPAWRP